MSACGLWLAALPPRPETSPQEGLTFPPSAVPGLHSGSSLPALSRLHPTPVLAGGPAARPSPEETAARVYGEGRQRCQRDVPWGADGEAGVLVESSWGGTLWALPSKDSKFFAQLLCHTQGLEYAFKKRLLAECRWNRETVVSEAKASISCRTRCGLNFSLTGARQGACAGWPSPWLCQRLFPRKWPCQALGLLFAFVLFGASTSKGTSSVVAESPENALLREFFITGNLSRRKHFDDLSKETFFKWKNYFSE